MKSIILIGMLIATAYAADEIEPECSQTVNDACSSNSVILMSHLSKNCDSSYSGYQKDRSSLLNKFANSLFQKSYDYMLSSTNFGSYIKNRPGLQKLFKNLADIAWEEGVAVIKHINSRGGAMDYNEKYVDGVFTGPRRSMFKDEIHALSYALDLEKESAARAHKIHQHFSHVHDAAHYDPGISHFMENNFIRKGSQVVHKLSGFVNELANLMSNTQSHKPSDSDSSIGISHFDDYLQTFLTIAQLLEKA